MKQIRMLVIPAILLACTSTPENEDPQVKKDCERVTITGSNIPRLICKTEDQRKKETAESQELYLRIQRTPEKPGRDF